MEEERTPKEEVTEQAGGGAADPSASILRQRLGATDPVAEHGQEMDLLCPECSRPIDGTYLPIFRCPHCDVMICVDEQGSVLWHQGEETSCPECGHTYRTVVMDMDQSPFRRFTRKIEDFVLGLDHVVQRALR